MWGFYSFLIIVILFIGLGMTPALASTATIVSAPNFVVYHPNLPGGDANAGIIYVSFEGSPTMYATYCADLGTFTSMGTSYTVGGGSINPQVSWIVSNYYPNSGVPDSGLSSAEEAAAVQLAIWHFTDNLVISSGGRPNDVFEAARTIISEAEGQEASSSVVPADLELSPQSATNPVGSQHSLIASLEDQNGAPLTNQKVSFMVSGVNPSSGMVFTDDGGQAKFSYVGDNPGDDKIVAKTDFTIPSGTKLVGLTSPTGVQQLVLAQSAPGFLAATATKTWNDLASPVISSVISSANNPCGSADTVITAHVSDNLGVSSVTLIYTDLAGSHNVAMTGVAGSKDGDWTGAIPGHTTGDTVTYSVRALDAAGNSVDAPTMGYYFSTWRDCNAPDIASIEPLLHCENVGIFVTAHVIDDDGVASVDLIYDGLTIPMTLQTGGTIYNGYWRLTQPIPPQTAGTILSIQIRAVDAVGHISTVNSALTVQSCPPTIVVMPGTSSVCTGEGSEIVAQVIGSSDIQSVKLFYRIGLGSYTSVDMDMTAGDNPRDADWVYFLSPCPKGTVISYYVMATDINGRTARDPLGDGSYELTWIACGGLLELTKTASSSSVAPGGTVTYTITYANNAKSDLHDVVITESYPSGAVFISASPSPDSRTNNRWTLGVLGAGDFGTITVTLKAPEDPNIRFNFEQMAKGVGFVRAYKDLTTGRDPYPMDNEVRITAKETSASAVSHVTVSGIVGTEVGMQESGSGSYSREELIYYYRENRSIKGESNLSAHYAPTSFGLPRGRSLEYSSEWAEAQCSKNYLTSESASEEYRYATKINKDSKTSIDGNGTSIDVESDFEGMQHMGYTKSSSPDSKGHREALMEFSSDYTGSFKVKEKLGMTFTNRSDAITGIIYYQQPHITIYQASESDRTDENNLNYTISILNDGDRALGPIYMRDVFPAGTFFFDASTKPSAPSEVNLRDSPYANWTFTYLPVGKSVTIYLRVNIYQVLDLPVNWVYVAAGYDGQWVMASNSTASNFNYLSCTPQGICEKTSSGWNPPDWGFDRSEDICGSCFTSLPEADGQSYCPSCRVGV